ncbi:MAG: SHOCT domain-containing protein [Haloechinothrix sp.]
MLLWSLLLLLIVVGGVWLAVRAFRDGSSSGSSGGSSALRILEDRFARGEIDRDEFEERRRTLGS